ncbi:hypothetical protein [Tenacibaculum aiptasiae]|uniref:hypothetical protein n=1 Tax=Tenacibaculum aiptasiae TaxID=426481 RepID=UPI0023306B9D|nr:hypothetical protein [Tenacibaculum aiptasiae]
MKNRLHRTILLLTIIVISSCKKEFKTNSKEKILFNGLKQSLSFDKVKNQNDNLSDFTFRIDTSIITTTNSIKGYFKNIEFYKLNISHYDSIYIGQRNDTIFTLDQGMDFVEVFLILNKNNISNLGRLGNDHGIHLLKSNDSIFDFHIRELEGSKYHDVIYTPPRYPKQTISEIRTDLNGKILNIKIRDKN